MNTGIGLGWVAIIVGVLVAYAFIWDALKYKRLDKKIDALDAKIDKKSKDIIVWDSLTDIKSESVEDKKVTEEVRSQEKEKIVVT
jgi:hypothetical protein